MTKHTYVKHVTALVFSTDSNYFSFLIYGIPSNYILHVFSQPVVDTDTLLKDHSQLTATVLDFESHMVREKR